jgi:large conductance mechanosensitive channel
MGTAENLWRTAMTSRAKPDYLSHVGAWGAGKATSLANEFRQFALKGNVVDLAVGVIIGAAFAKIVDSLVKHILMPVISLIIPSEQSYLAWKLVVDGKEIPYGLFLGEVVNFLVVALALFLFVVKFLGWVARRRALETPPPAPAPTKGEQLLTEIRDLLAAENSRR